MSFIRSLAGFAFATTVGYTAGILMCVDAYHLGQADAFTSRPAEISPRCLPQRPPAAASGGVPAPSIPPPYGPQVGDDLVCFAHPTEFSP